MRLELEIGLDNAAFEGTSGDLEVARILCRLAQTFEDYGLDGAGDQGLFDINGNRVGKYAIDRW